MFWRRWRLFRLLGFPIYVDASWLLILALVSWTLEGMFRQAVPDLSEGNAWVLGVGTALAYFLCIVLHELGHAVVARARGIPIRGITLFLFGGVSEMRQEPPSAGSEFAMAIAGPVVTAVLTGLFYLVAYLGRQAGWSPGGVFVLHYLGWINLIVLLFNMLPAFPLDGGRVFRSIVWGATGNLRRATYWASRTGQLFALLGMVLAGVLLFFYHDLISALWLFLVSLFLNGAAQSTYQQLLIREALKGEPVRRFMNTRPITVPPGIDLRQLVDDYVYRHHRKAFPVVRDGRLEGFIGTRALSRYPREEWGQHTVAEVMHHDLRAITIGPDADALQALARMQRTGMSRLLVTEDGRLVGIVSLKDLLRFFQLKLQLDDEGKSEEPAPPA
jgi:Zn-dependent protease/CBS domain-containing protein